MGTGSSPPRFHTGNAATDGADRRGWLLGYFLPEGDLRQSNDVEVKWRVHRGGEERAERVADEHRTTVVLLVRGRFRVDLDPGPVVLRHPGDYVMWGPGVGHSWRAEEDSVVVTVRWPSKP